MLLLMVTGDVVFLWLGGLDCGHVDGLFALVTQALAIGIDDECGCLNNDTCLGFELDGYRGIAFLFLGEGSSLKHHYAITFSGNG